MHSRLENRINYKFSDKKLLEEALTHKSYSVERGLSYYNERLEFLGDSVIGLVVCSFLYRKHPGKDEGFLSKIKSYIVSRANLAEWGSALSLKSHIKISSSEKGENEMKSSIISNAFEALVGAVYLDGGFEEAYKLVIGFMEQKELIYEDVDFKSKFQEYSQKKHKVLPLYEVIFTEGPEHKKIFVVNLSLAGKVISIGKGKSKKEAEQKAAESAIRQLDSESHHKKKQ